MPKTTCPACNKTLASITGYSLHLAKTTNPACRALYIASRQFQSSPTPDPQDDDPAMELDTIGTGLYAEDDLESPGPLVDERNRGDMLTDNSDDSDSDDGIDSYDEWEPPAPAYQPPNQQAACHDHGSNDDPDPLPPALNMHEPHDAWCGVQRRLREREQMPIVVHYPNQRLGAGQPVDSAQDSSNATYGAQLDDSNIYAPFASKVDWEIAWWAKLRGPSSTAFSELVSIEGVSPH